MDWYSKVKEVYPALPQTLRDGQRKMIDDLFHHRTSHMDFLGVFPTGYGKSEIYGIFPLYLDLIDSNVKHAVLVVSPLKALASDQQKRWNSMGIPCAVLKQHNTSTTDQALLVSGEVKIIITSPEQIVHYMGSKNSITSSKISLLVVDEVHCVQQWTSFREAYTSIGGVRALLPVNCLLLTATMNVETLKQVRETMMVDAKRFKIHAMSPNRPEIKLVYGQPKDLSCFTWLVDELKTKKLEARKTIIYCRSIDETSKIWKFLTSQLGQDAYYPPTTNGSPQYVQDRLVERYHALGDQQTGERIVQGFPKMDTKLKCVVATIALGMGMDIPDTDIIIHWGFPNSFMSYSQEIGRCARGPGRQGTAIIYDVAVHQPIDKDLKEFRESLRRGKCDCMRASLVKHLWLPTMGPCTLKQGVTCLKGNCTKCICEACKCCSICTTKCPCTSQY